MRISQWKQKLMLTAGYLGILLVFSLLKVPCLFQTFLHIPCPGCGMTRAVKAALRLDLAAAFRYHSMFWSMPILYLYFLFDNGLFQRKWLDRVVLLSIAAGFLLHWISILV